MIPIPITFLTAHRAKLAGSTERHVSCESCGEPYVYVVKRTVSATILSPFDVVPQYLANRWLREQTQRRLQQALELPDLVACPQCGFLQHDMIRRQRRRRLRSGLIMAIGGGALLFLVGLLASLAFAWPLVAGTLAAAAIMPLASGWVIWELQRDPNDDDGSSRRKEAARRSRGIPQAD